MPNVSWASRGNQEVFKKKVEWKGKNKRNEGKKNGKVR